MAMFMAERPSLGGRLGLRAMGSLEPWTIGGCGYPDLLAPGQAGDRGVVQDAQHPHDLWMELSTRYDRPLTGQLRWQTYIAAAGEPALGPVEFSHRPSAFSNPLAPIGHVGVTLRLADVRHIIVSGIERHAVHSAINDFRRWMAGSAHTSATKSP
jgi:hypothetical protein